MGPIFKRGARRSYQAAATLCAGLVVAGLAGGCGDPEATAEEPSLGPIESILDPGANIKWPGEVDDDGVRRVPRRTAFFDGEPVSFWYGLPSTRATADIFWFCRRGAQRCPLDEDGVLVPSSAIGDPIFARMPGEFGYTPYWLVWIVSVDDDYQPNSIKSVFGVEQASAAGEVEVTALVFDHGGSIGPNGAVMNCLLVLAGTELEGNGGEIVGKPGVLARHIELRQGWHKQYRVNYFDFTASEGIIPPDDASESRPQMPASDMYVLQRDCAAGSASPVCDGAESDLVSVDEPDLERDINGDGDMSDTNNVLGGFPGSSAANDMDRPYTALWRLLGLRVAPAHDAEVELIDGGGASQVTSTAQIGELVDAGWLDEPVLMIPPPESFEKHEMLFNGAVQVPE